MTDGEESFLGKCVYNPGMFCKSNARSTNLSTSWLARVASLKSGEHVGLIGGHTTSGGGS